MKRIWSIAFVYELFRSRIIHTYVIGHLGVSLDSKMYFLQHVDYIFSQALKLFGRIRTETFFFSSADSLLTYFTLVRPKLNILRYKEYFNLY